MQHKQADPLQYFFTNSTRKAPSPRSDSQHQLSQLYKNIGIKGTVKMESMPLAANKILLRFENLADIGMDLDATTSTIDLLTLVTTYWTIVNPDIALEHYKIEETNHSGTLSVEAMAARRLTWQTRDDAKPHLIKSKTR